MKLIAHRGNISGPSDEENSFRQINRALDKGYHVELDALKYNLDNHSVVIGHDTPVDVVDVNFLRNDRIWVHAKNPETLVELLRYKDINCFYHTDAPITVTSHGYAWHHSDNSKNFNRKSVLVVLDCYPYRWSKDKPYAICTDYPLTYMNSVPESFKEASIFKLLILDIDGVMTNGKKAYDLDANVDSKEFCDRDFTAIKRFKAAGIKVCFLTGDINVNERLSSRRNIDCFFSRSKKSTVNTLDKSQYLQEIANKYNVELDDVAYVGDDFYDLSLLDQVNWSFCPADASLEVKLRVKNIIKCNGGDGVVAELFSMYSSLLNKPFPYDNI